MDALVDEHFLVQRPEEFTGGVLGIPYLVVQQGDRNEVFRDEANDPVVRKGARTEPGGVASAPLEGMGLLPGPNEQGSLFFFGFLNTFVEINEPRDLPPLYLGLMAA